MPESEKETMSRDTKPGRDIGIDVPIPEKSCNDKYCPFHGSLPVRGQILEGTVVSDKMAATVVVEREIRRLVPKYQRYEKRRKRYSAHNPPCINARTGNQVRIMECRSLGKTVSFVVIEEKVRT